MKRTEALEILKKNIPSFGREWDFADIYPNTPLGWLYEPQSDMPDPIPEDFLEGTKVLHDGNEFTVGRIDKIIRELHNGSNEQNRPDGRRVMFSYNNYAGHPHLYGRLEIQGAELIRETEKGFQSTSPNEQDKIANPELKKLKYEWTVELRRILPKEEIEANPHYWESYYEGYHTNRFLDKDELLASGLYTALSIIQGPFHVYLGYGYVNESIKNLVMTVGASDEVTLYNINRLFKQI